MTKLKRISSHIRVMTKLYPNMDKRKIRRDAYYFFSAEWQDFRNKHPNSIITAL
ncbi:hypothetical protein SA80RD_46 [Escherichia phage vB_EcoS_SA80RD]|nr:hypothetical protein SA80RD_46 [Escherichia phage vB_EcoS_SA80RD]